MKNTKKATLALIIGALGVVFGDIGTSPLYAITAIFGSHNHLAINQTNVHGIISVVIWAITLVVSVKFIGFLMRANNQGEGGIIALTALIKGSKLKTKYASILVFMGLIGVAMFYGDSAITPAISVLSAVEGLKIISPSLSSLVIPITLIILVSLFWIQKYGTKVIGKLFGPVMLIWFLIIAGAGIWQIFLHPHILAAISPLAAINFFVNQPLLAFLSMSAVILAITGVEALYADMGHFGRAPIAKAWFFLVFPALLICYMGQGALILDNPAAISSPLYLMFPDSLHFIILIIATLATIIASQAVISGAFSLTSQAINLGFLPKMIVKHTSNKEIGRVYVPFVNIVLFIVVSMLVLIFGASQKLADAYGMAVSFTLAIDTILFIAVAKVIWKKSLFYVVIAAVVFLSIDLLFVSSSLTKLLTGGWFPLILAILILIVLTTWIKGQKIVTKKRRSMEGPLQEFVEEINELRPRIKRVPGGAVYIGHHADLAPLALHATVEKLRELHKKVIIVTVNSTNKSHIPEDERATYDDLKYNDGICHVNLSYGFHDPPNVPRALEAAHNINPKIDFNTDTVEYFISQSKIVQNKRKDLAGWRKTLYCLMARNAVSTSDYYKLPTDRTIEIRSLIEI